MQTGYEILLENVRCFAGKHTIPIRPLTLLVGENSTGKTALLALRASLAYAFPGKKDEQIDPFNVPPYELGSFATIASQSGAHPAKTFRVGYRRNGFELALLRRDRDGKPSVLDLSMQIPHGLDVPSSVTLSPEERKNLGQQMLAALEAHPEYRLLHSWSLAPVRAQPKRTYDALGPEFSPEGDHIPLLLSRLLRDPKKAEAKQLIDLLTEFAKDAGLFEDLRVRYLGDQVGDPFQIQVTLGGKWINYRDVGYGVSQALPVIVESSLTAAEKCLLVQQPEVHLHPRAQAALGSFFAGLVSKLGKECIIETHSDYLLDRVRQEVARGTLTPAQVQILYFERDGLAVQVHPISLDAQGNLLGAPPSYRSFFMEEETRLLTRGEPAPPPRKQAAAARRKPTPKKR